MVPASLEFLQFTYIVSAGLPLAARYSHMSAQNLLAVTVFPVPTPPHSSAEHWRPSMANGRNRVSSLESCSSRWTRSWGMYEKSRTDPSRMMTDLLSNIFPPRQMSMTPSRNETRPRIIPILATFSALRGSLNTDTALTKNATSARTTV